MYPKTLLLLAAVTVTTCWANSDILEQDKVLGELHRVGRSLLRVAGAELEPYHEPYASPTLRCNGEGVYSHPSDCTKFYRCIDVFNNKDYRRLAFKCEAGTIFSPEYKSCISGTCSPNLSSAALRASAATGDVVVVPSFRHQGMHSSSTSNKYGVHWVRDRDVHIISVGGFTYTSDERFYTTRDEQGGNWMLNIKYVQVRDAGIYYCQQTQQLNTKMSYYVYLDVLVKQAYIVGGHEKYVKGHSDFVLACTVNSLVVPQKIFWYHNDRLLISIDGQIDIEISSDSESSTTSKLTVFSAQRQDSGNYTCVPYNGQGYSTTVHVMTDTTHDVHIMVGGSRGSTGSPAALTLLGIIMMAAAISL